MAVLKFFMNIRCADLMNKRRTNLRLVLRGALKLAGGQSVECLSVLLRNLNHSI